MCVAVCRWVLPDCARSVCVVTCRVAVWWCVLCFAWCCVGRLCWAWFLLRAAAPCCCLLVHCCGPWLCSVLGCGAALLWCAASRAVGCCGAVLFLSRWLVPCGVACGCWLFGSGSGCLLLFLAGVCCRGCSCLAAWLAALLCAMVCCGDLLPCAVSCVLWCYDALWCRAVVPCCPFSLPGGVGLCLFPACAVLCSAARRVVWCRFGLHCCWCLVLWCVAVCFGVSLGVLRCGGAALVGRGVLLCRALSCGVLRPVVCPAVLCCLAVLCWLAVLCGCLRCWCLFFLLSSFPLLKTPAVFQYLCSAIVVSLCLRTGDGVRMSRGWCTCCWCGGAWEGESECWLRAPAPSVAPRAPPGVCVLIRALGAPPVARVARVVSRQGVSGGRPAPLRGPSEVRRSPSPCCPSSGRAVTVRHPLPVGAGARGRGPSTVLLARMPCRGLCAAGVVGGRLREGGRPLLRWASGVRRSPPSGCPSLEAWSQGSAARVSRVLLSSAWGSSTGPTACALASRFCAL